MLELDQYSQWSALKNIYDTMLDGPFGLKDLDVPQTELDNIAPLNAQHAKLNLFMSALRNMLQGYNIFETKTT